MYTEKYDSTLKHYWPVTDHVKELISGCDLSSDNPALVSDRLGRPYSAFRVSDHSSFMTAPPTATYVHSNFTFMMWLNMVYLPEPGQGQDLVLFDCGDFNNQNNFYVHVTNTDHILVPMLTLDSSRSWVYNRNSMLPYKQWVHIAIVSKPGTSSVFLNGLKVDTGNDWLYPPKVGFTRTNCYFGKTNNWSVSGEKNVADFDEIMIFERALSTEEIYAHFKNDNYIVEI
jgi:hypothetical protein